MDTLLRRREMMKQSSHILPSAYQPVAYVEATGTQIIPTTFYPVVDSEAEMYCKFAFTELSEIKILLSSVYQSSSTNNCMFQFPTSSTTFYYQGTARANMNNNSKIAVLVANTDYEMTLTNRKITIIGQETLAKTTDPVFVNVLEPVTLFGQNSTEEGTRAKAKIYDFWYKQNGNYAIWLIPCYRKSDREPGMYDLANGVFYVNTGTGELITGPEV